MRLLLVVAVATVLLTGCGTDLISGASEPPTASPSAVATDPTTWVMDANSFGPITAETTKSQALATGYYEAAPPPCSKSRLDWRGQRYRDVPGTDDRELVKPILPTITFDEGGAPKYIDPAPHTITDRGIRRADSLSRLMITYGDDLIPALDQSSHGGTFAVFGDRSHLVFVVLYGKVIGFFIAVGHVDEPEDVMTVAGSLTKAVDVRPGRDGTC